MNPQMLVDQASSGGIPAPCWFIQFFKVLGFTLHMVPMNLWYAGLLVALGLHLVGREHGRRFAARLIQQMPVIIAVGVNFGVVPLLFVQLAYFKFFYPATILMAWFWLAIIGLLIPAYYGVYIYAWALRGDRGSPLPQAGEGSGVRAGGLEVGSRLIPTWKRLVGWLAAVFFVAIGFLFVNGMSLLDHVARWPALWKATRVAGAVTGTALNIGDATLWPRWLLMFGLALGTTAVWVVIDAVWLMSDATEAYRQWAWKFAKVLYTVSMVWTATAGAWYVFGTWSPELQESMFRFPLIVLTGLTAVASGLPWALLATEHWCNAKRATAAGLAVAQFGVLGINAVSRQVAQNLNLRPFLDVLAQPTEVQWGPLVMFLVIFVLGLCVVAWILAQVFSAKSAALAKLTVTEGEPDR